MPAGEKPWKGSGVTGVAGARWASSGPVIKAAAALTRDAASLRCWPALNIVVFTLKDVGTSIIILLIDDTAPSMGSLPVHVAGKGQVDTLQVAQTVSATDA